MDERLIPLTVPKVRRLLYRLIWRHHSTDESVLQWSGSAGGTKQQPSAAITAAA